MCGFRHYAYRFLLTVSAASVVCPARTQPTTDAVHPARFLGLQTAAALAARPQLCAASANHMADVSPASSWAQVRAADVWQRCLRLARGHTDVMLNPQAVLVSLQRATPRARRAGHAADALVLAERALEARAWLRSGDAAKAYALFSELRATSPIAEWHVFAVHDYAVSARYVGQLETALACYRRLVSLAAWLPNGMKASVLVEAAATALHATPNGALEARRYLAVVESETLSSELARVVAVLQVVANGVLEPTRTTHPERLPAQSGTTSAVRLPEEDVRFIELFTQYSESGRWSDEQSGSATSGTGFTSPVYLNLIARMRATQ